MCWGGSGSLYLGELVGGDAGVGVVGRGGEDVPGRAASPARGSGNAAGTLRDAVRGLARDLRLEMRAARGNAGRLVAKEEELLRWLDKRTRVEGRVVARAFYPSERLRSTNTGHVGGRSEPSDDRLFVPR